MPDRGVTIAPGSYLRDMREADGKTVREVARILGMLKLCGLGRVWPCAAGDLVMVLVDVEGDHRAATVDQLCSLTLAFPFRLARYRELVALRSKEPAHV